MLDDVINVTTTIGPVADANDETGLTPGIDIDALLDKRAKYLRLVDQAEATLLLAAQYGEARFELRGRGRWGATCFPSDGARAELVRAFDADHWRLLLKGSGLYSLLDKTARDSWNKSLDDGTAPALTRENIEATFTMLHAQRGEMFDRGVVEVFRLLSFDYKTNNAVKLGRRLIIEHASSGHGPEFNFCNKLDDLLRVMSVLDGKLEPDHRQGAYYTISTGWPRTVNDVEVHGFFSVRGFKNGNCHLTFLRPDLVTEMNRIIARRFPNALPPAT